MTIELQDAINNAKTLEALIPIAEHLEAKISFWGSRYVTIETKQGEERLNYRGWASLDTLLKRALKIIDESGRPKRASGKFSPAEHEAGRRLENAISTFYLDDKNNVLQTNLITKIIIFFRSFFETSYQFEWKDDKFGRREQLLLRDPCSVWDNNAKKYVPWSDTNRNLWMIHRRER